MKKINLKKQRLITVSSLLLLPFLSGCNDPEEQTVSISSATHAVIATVASDYSSGAMSIVNIDQPRTIVNDISPTISDITVATDGENIYRLERFMADNVAKFDVNNPTDAIWQYSTLDDGEAGSSNPYDFITASDSKAYILRYGKSKAWIVNPSATIEADFKIGEIDLSVYDADAVPNMDKGIIVDGKLFITMQALDDSWAPGQAYVAVFDVATDTEIDTEKSTIKGIPLPIKNPGNIQYSAANNKIYIQGAGKYPSFGTDAVYDGGIISLDPSTYDIEIIVDDGDASSAPYGNIINLAIVSPTQGYFVGYAGWGDNTLYSFNPTTKEVDSTAVANIYAKNIADIEVGPLGKLWVASKTDFGIIIVDPTTGMSEEQIISTGSLTPAAIVFARAE